MEKIRHQILITTASTSEEKLLTTIKSYKRRMLVPRKRESWQNIISKTDKFDNKYDSDDFFIWLKGSISMIKNLEKYEQMWLFDESVTAQTV